MLKSCRKKSREKYFKFSLLSYVEAAILLFYLYTSISVIFEIIWVSEPRLASKFSKDNKSSKSFTLITTFVCSCKPH